MYLSHTYFRKSGAILLQVEEDRGGQRQARALWRSLHPRGGAPQVNLPPAERRRRQAAAGRPQDGGGAQRPGHPLKHGLRGADFYVKVEVTPPGQKGSPEVRFISPTRIR